MREQTPADRPNGHLATAPGSHRREQTDQTEQPPADPNIWKPVGDGAWVGSRASERYPVYTRGNAGEVYPEVFTPLSFSVAAQSGDLGFRNAVLRTGLVRRRDIDEAADVGVGNGVFGGYAYLNLTFARLVALRLFGARLEDVDVQFMGAGDPPAHRPDKRDRWILGTLRGMRYQWRTLRATDPPPELARDQQRVEEFLAGLPDPAAASDSELRGDIDELMPMFADLFEQHLVISGQAGLAVGTLTNLCGQYLDDPSLAVTLLSGLGDVESAEPAQAMWALSRIEPTSPEFDTAFAAFLAQHGCRGPNEWDTAFDTWETEPELARALVDRMRLADDSHEPARQTARLARERIEAEGEALARLSGIRQRVFRRVLRSARMFSRARSGPRRPSSAPSTAHVWPPRSSTADSSSVPAASAATCGTSPRASSTTTSPTRPRSPRPSAAGGACTPSCAAASHRSTSRERCRRSTRGSSGTPRWSRRRWARSSRDFPAARGRPPARPGSSPIRPTRPL